MIGGNKMANKICGIYKITNNINGKFYIGSSNDIKNRWYQHKKKLNSEEHGNPHLQKAWILYGGDNFVFEVIEECSPETRFEREQFYLNALNPFDDNGYNIVRKISQEYMSDNYIETICERCLNTYSTFNHRSKYCDKCKDIIKQNFLEEKRNGYHLSAKAEEEGYENYMKRWSNTPVSWWYD